MLTGAAGDSVFSDEAGVRHATAGNIRGGCTISESPPTANARSFRFVETRGGARFLGSPNELNSPTKG